MDDFGQHGKWFHVSELLPQRNEYVLAYTPFCRYKCAVAFWNGVTWRSADNKSEVWNINYWQYLPKLPDKQKVKSNTLQSLEQFKGSHEEFFEKGMELLSITIGKEIDEQVKNKQLKENEITPRHPRNKKT